MAANTILLKGDLARRHEEFVASGICKPGHLLQLDSNNKVLKYATAGGASRMVAKEDALQGKTVTQAYAVGDVVPTHLMAATDKVQLRLPAAAPAVVIGDRLVSDGTGCVVKGLSSSSNLYTATAASAAVTNTVTETAFDKTYTFAANQLKAGDVIRIRGQAIATATNSTDTLTIRVKIGSTTVVASAALDVANNDVAVFDITLVIRTAGASGTVVGSGFVTIGPPATATVKPFALASTTIDTTATQAITVTAQWSVADPGNSVRLDNLVVGQDRSAGAASGETVGIAAEAIDNSLGADEAFIGVWAA